VPRKSSRRKGSDRKFTHVPIPSRNSRIGPVRLLRRRIPAQFADEADDKDVRIDMLEMLPTPGGLVRSGVAPTMCPVGWIKRGPSGVIGSNNKDSAHTVDTLLADLDEDEADQRGRTAAHHSWLKGDVTTAISSVGLAREALQW
jgi:hypothetical protein